MGSNSCTAHTLNLGLQIAPEMKLVFNYYFMNLKKTVSYKLLIITHGNFIRMKIQQVTNEMKILMNPTQIKRSLLSFGVDGLCV